MWGKPVDTIVYPRDYSGPGSSAFQPLAFGSWLTVRSSVTGEDAGRVTIRQPIDVTDAARDAALPAPENGVYLACPVVVDVDRDALSDPRADVKLPEGDFRPPTSFDGDWPDPAGILLPGYPRRHDLTGLDEDDRFTYYEIFDVSPETADGGQCTVWLTAAEDASWGSPWED